MKALSSRIVVLSQEAKLRRLIMLVLLTLVVYLGNLSQWTGKFSLFSRVSWAPYATDRFVLVFATRCRDLQVRLKLVHALDRRLGI